MRSWMGAICSLGGQVTIAHEYSFFSSGPTARAHSPANAKGSRSGRWIQNGCLPLSVCCHS